MAPRNPNPKTEHLLRYARGKMPPGFKSDVLRIRVHEDAFVAFAALTPEGRGEIVQQWFNSTEADHD